MSWSDAYFQSNSFDVADLDVEPEEVAIHPVPECDFSIFMLQRRSKKGKIFIKNHCNVHDYYIPEKCEEPLAYKKEREQRIIGFKVTKRKPKPKPNETITDYATIQLMYPFRIHEFIPRSVLSINVLNDKNEKILISKEALYPPERVIGIIRMLIDRTLRTGNYPTYEVYFRVSAEDKLLDSKETLDTYLDNTIFKLIIYSAVFYARYLDNSLNFNFFKIRQSGWKQRLRKVSLNHEILTSVKVPKIETKELYPDLDQSFISEKRLLLEICKNWDSKSILREQYSFRISDLGISLDFDLVAIDTTGTPILVKLIFNRKSRAFLDYVGAMSILEILTSLFVYQGKPFRGLLIISDDILYRNSGAARELVMMNDCLVEKGCKKIYIVNRKNGRICSPFVNSHKN